MDITAPNYSYSELDQYLFSDHVTSILRGELRKQHVEFVCVVA